MLALGAGARLDVVSRHFGHASATFTADIYTHDSDEAAHQQRGTSWGNFGGMKEGPKHRALSFALVVAVAGAGFEPATSGL